METRAALVSGSVVGRDFPLPLLAAVSGVAPGELERRLEEAERAGLVIGQGRASWRFSHVLVREALYRELDPAARAEGHQRVAAALEASGRGDAVVAEIAHHRLSALPGGDAAAAAAAARTAADRAMALLAFEDAAQLLQRARQAVESTGAPDRRELCELELLEGMAWMRAGDAARGRAACSAAADEARRLGAGDLLARAALGYGAELMLAQTDPLLVALLQEALQVLPPGPGGWRAQVLARLAATLQPARDVQVPMAMAREAIAMARATGDSTILRTVLLAGGAALADYAPPAERAAVSEELVALASAAGDRFQLMRAQSRLVFDHFELGSVARAARALDAYEALAREFRQNRHLWPGRLMRSMLESAQGRFDESTAGTREAAALAEGDADRPTDFVFAWCRQGHALESERAAELAAAEEQVSRITPPPPTCPSCPPPSSTSPSPACGRACRTSRPRLPAGSGRPRGKTQPNDAELFVMLAEPVVCWGPAARARLPAPAGDRGPRRQLRPLRHVLRGAGGLALGMLAGLMGSATRRTDTSSRGATICRAGGLRPHLAQNQYWHARSCGSGDARRGGARALAAAAERPASWAGLEELKLRCSLPGSAAHGAAATRVSAASPARPAALPAAPPFPFPRGGLLDGHLGRRRAGSRTAGACSSWPSCAPTRAASSTCSRSRAPAARGARRRRGRGARRRGDRRLPGTGRGAGRRDRRGRVVRRRRPCRARPRGAGGHRGRAGGRCGPGRPRPPDGRRRRARAHQRAAPHPGSHPQDRRVDPRPGRLPRPHRAHRHLLQLRAAVSGAGTLFLGRSRPKGGAGGLLRSGGVDT